MSHTVRKQKAARHFLRIPHLGPAAKAQPRRPHRLALELLEPRWVLDSSLVISEFLAANEHNIVDEDGDFSDWLEIQNPTADPINLNHWYLTDNPTELTKWQFPDISLNPGEYRLVFASDKDRTNPSNELHTNFKLDKGGEFLGLVRPDGATIEYAYSPQFPPQATDVSYGLSTDLTARGYFFAPTPGAENTGQPFPQSSRQVLISEIMYHPYHAANTAEDTGQEYIELLNRGNNTVNLAGWRFTRGLSFIIPDVPQATLAPGEYLVVAADLTTFQNTYAVPPGTKTVGGFSGRLANGGETIELVDAAGAAVDSVRYADQGDWATIQRPVHDIKSVDTMVRAGSTVTVTVPNHGYSNNNWIRITGANQASYNGTWRIANVTANTFTFTLPSGQTPATPATGTITCFRPEEQVHGHDGWDWTAQHDGGGKSLELVNVALSNDYGQNWAPSAMPGGTPGATNSVAAANIAPLILDVTHSPVIPRHTDPVTITARILDELAFGSTVNAYYRADGTPDFTTVVMLDDGQHGDGRAGDGVFGTVLPPQADRTVVEFYVSAADAAQHLRTWPAPTQPGGQQLTNLLYQVDDTFDPNAAWVPGSPPIYRLVMTEAERAELAEIDSQSNGEEDSDAQMNGTFISVDGTGMEVRYNVSIRNRGHGTRTGPPNNYHVGFASDRPWKDVDAINFNCRYTHVQILGSAIFRMAGIAAPNTAPAQLRVNGANLASTGSPMWGVYASLEAFNSDFAEEHFPDDPNGNLYSCFRTDPGVPYQEAELTYEGTNPDVYRGRYFKESNAAADDWSDLIHMLDVLNNAPDATYLQEVSQVINLPQWLRYIALDSLLNNYETGLNRGVGDDYFMYRGGVDTRFVLVPHDLDTILGEGSEAGNISQSIFSVVNGVGSANGVDGLKRLFNHPDVIPLYYQAFVDLLSNFFNPETLNPLVDQVLGSITTQTRINAIKNFIVNRRTEVLKQIPRQFTISTTLPQSGAYYLSTGSTAPLSGTADAAYARSVLVNGQPATWNARTGAWSINAPLRAGINRLLVESFDGPNGTGNRVHQGFIDVRYDGSQQPSGPQILVARGSDWYYLDTGADMGTAWREKDFDHLGWQHGPAELGYGDTTDGRPEATVVGYIDADPNTTGIQKNITTYFRRSFTVDDPSKYSALLIRLLRDDGAVVYLNGFEIARNNMTVDAPTPVLHTTPARNGTADEARFLDIALPAEALSHLLPGTNVLAVEIHQDAPDSSDISFDLELEATIPLSAAGAMSPVSNTQSSLANQQLSIVAPSGYLPGIPFLVQSELLQDASQLDRDQWDATVTLSTNRPDITLSTTQIRLYNGIGSALVTVTGAGDFTLSATMGNLVVSRTLVSLAAAPVTTISGTLAGSSSEWNGVVHITGDLLVPAGHTLTIQPGTLVLLDGVASGTTGVDIDVQGNIQSLGTAAAPVTFTAADPTKPWGEIHHTSAGASLYQYTNIHRAGSSPGVGHTGTGPAVRTAGSNIVFDHSTITDNVGKAMMADNSNLTFQQSLLARSRMGPEIAGSALLFDHSHITEMRGPDDADAIYIHSQQAGQTVLLRGSVIAGMDDDGIDTLGSTLTVEDVIVRDTKDKGISVYGGQVTIRASLLANNSLAPEDGSGATISAKGTNGSTVTVNIDRTTIVGPGVGIEGHDKYGYPDVVVQYFVTNSIIRAPDAVRTDYDPADIHISYSNVSETWPGTGNLTADPLFVDPAVHNYRLQPGSPSINAGDPAAPPDADGTRADQGFFGSGLGGVLAPKTIPAGTISQDTILTPAGGPYHVTGNVILAANATLRILPGTTVYFDAATSLTVRGRLIAEGDQYNRIRLTRVPSGAYIWDGVQLRDTMQDNVLSYVDIEYAESMNGSIGAVNSNVLIDHMTWAGSHRRLVYTNNSSAIIRNCVFPDRWGPNEAPGASDDNVVEDINTTGIPAGGHFIIENNIFGTNKGHNDIVDFSGPSRPGPVMQVLNNVFLGGGDEAFDLGGDIYLEGNIFMHFHKDQWNTGTGDSNVISTGDNLSGTASTVSLVRNVFLDNDHIVDLKNDTYMFFENNTVVGIPDDVGTTRYSVIKFLIPGRNQEGKGAYLDGNIFWNVPKRIFENVDMEFSGDPNFRTELVMNRSLIPPALTGEIVGKHPGTIMDLGVGNLAADPRLVDMINTFLLRAGSPAIAAGPNGLDMGALVPAGASITGEPPALTTQTTATLTVDGPAITHYKYRVNGGAWSAETPVSTPIQLANLADGLYTVQVIGKNFASAWQDEAQATTKTWTVKQSLARLRINEVLAVNMAAVANAGAFPDAIELYYDAAPGAAPINLKGLSLSDTPTRPQKFVFQNDTLLVPGQYLVLFADDAMTAPGLHLGFSLDGDGEGVYLYQAKADGGALLDSVEFGLQVADHSIGRVGQDGHWALTQPTFGAANLALPTGDPATLMLNEWLASGNVRLTDDYIELFNPDSRPVPLGGLYLTDNPVNQPGKHKIAPLSFIAAGGSAAFTADGQPQRGPSHLNFKLSAEQEILGLYDANLKQIDNRLYYAQTTDYSQGRLPDGASTYAFLRLPTPNAPDPVANDPAVVRAMALIDGLRVTQLMYNPTESADLEYIELMNVGPTPLNLAGVRLTGGVEFTFSASTLDPGQRLILVRDLAAFTTHYGPSVSVAGEYTGNLSNGGENLVLQLPTPYDAAILRFDFDDAWYPSTDGNGSALAIRNPNAAAASWQNSSSWQAAAPPWQPVPHIAGRHIFYNASAFDGVHPGANPLDDVAIAPNKQALRPGQTATFANYTTYDRGINGIMIDLAHRPAAGVLDVTDFSFLVGNSDDPSTWVAAPLPTSVTVRPEAGDGDSDRVTLIWANGAIKNQWLQVTVLANADTGLAVPDVFYFGNAVGDTGNSPHDAKVDAADILATRYNHRSLLNPAPISSPYDFDRNKRVNAVDVLLARNNQTNFATALRLITPAVAQQAAAPTALRPAAKQRLAASTKTADRLSADPIAAVHDAVLQQTPAAQLAARASLASNLDWLTELPSSTEKSRSSKTSISRQLPVDRIMASQEP